MAKPALVAALALVLANGAASPAPAAERPPVVTAVRVENLGGGPMDQAFIKAHISVRPGKPLDQAAISKDLRQLLATGRFSKVKIVSQPAGDGVCVVYRVKNKLKLGEPLHIVGARHFREEKIRDWIDLKPGDLVDDQIIGTRVQKVLREYREDSYPDAAITWTITEKDPALGVATVTLRVTEGQRARIRAVTFSGNTVFPAGELRKTLKPPPWWNVFRWFSRDRYERDAVEEARAEIRALYLDRGYLDVEVDQPQVGTDQAGRVYVRYNIHEGPAYRLGRIQLQGVTLFPETEVRKVIKVKTGDVAGRAAIQEAANAVQDFYGSRGYVESSVRPVLHPDPNSGRVDVDFVITEGRLVYIRNIIIRGNARTRDKVIRREILVAPGEIFNEVKVRQSERILSNLGFFSSVRSTPLTTELEDHRDLVFEVEEKQTGQFMVGGGFSSVDRITGFVELTQGNFDLFGWPYFTGGGQKLKLSSQFGSRRKQYGISFVEPWFLNRKLSLGVDLDRTEIKYSDYRIERTGGGVTLGKALPGPNRISLGYRLEKARTHGLADTNLYYYTDGSGDEYRFQEEDRTKSTLTLTWTHDTRNRPFLPTRGNLTRVFGSVSGGPLGFDTDIYNVGFNCVQYFPLWFQHVLSLRTRWEVVDAYGNTEEVPLSDRLFVGGGRTIRGYDYREVGPKVVPVDPRAASRRYRPVGGRSLAMAKADYSIPLVTPLRLAAFFDIGNVWRDVYDFDLSNLASSAGVGLRFDIPGFPIAIDRAWPVHKDSDLTDEDAWVFWIGFEY